MKHAFTNLLEQFARFSSKYCEIVRNFVNNKELNKAFTVYEAGFSSATASLRKLLAEYYDGLSADERLEFDMMTTATGVLPMLESATEVLEEESGIQPSIRLVAVLESFSTMQKLMQILLGAQPTTHVGNSFQYTETIVEGMIRSLVAQTDSAARRDSGIAGDREHKRA
jgi:hypothetical protein